MKLQTELEHLRNLGHIFLTASISIVGQRCQRYPAMFSNLRCVAAAKPDKQANHCPLCHINFAPGEEGWKMHLMGKEGCKENPRRLPALNRGALLFCWQLIEKNYEIEYGFRVIFFRNHPISEIYNSLKNARRKLSLKKTDLKLLS